MNEDEEDIPRIGYLARTAVSLFFAHGKWLNKEDIRKRTDLAPSTIQKAFGELKGRERFESLTYQDKKYLRYVPLFETEEPTLPKVEEEKEVKPQEEEKTEEEIEERGGI